MVSLPLRAGFVSLSALIAASPALAQQASLVAIPKSTVAHDCTDDGRVVGVTEDHRPFLWSAEDGLLKLDSLDPENSYGIANAVSADGRYIVGRSADRAVRWKANGEVELLVDIFGEAYAVSADGSVVVGRVSPGTGGTQAFRWSEKDGFELLGVLSDSQNESEAHGVSIEGDYVVGYSEVDSGHNHAFRWSRAEGMIDLAPDEKNLVATSVSENGRYVVGYVHRGNYSRAYIWNKATGLVDLAVPSQTSRSYAYKISANGAVVTGSCDGFWNSPITGGGCVWTDGEPKLVQDSLVGDYAVDLSDWEGEGIGDLFGCSPDGTRMAMFGRYQGEYRGGLLTIPAPPEIDGVEPPPAAQGIDSFARSAGLEPQVVTVKVEDYDVVKAKIGEPIEIHFRGKDPGGDDLSFFAEGLPADASITPAPGPTSRPNFRGVLSWTPDEDDIGPADEIHLYVRDVEDRRASLRFKLRAVPAIPPTVESLLPVTVECRPGTSRVRLETFVDDPEGDRLKVEWRVNGRIRKTERVDAGTLIAFQFDYPHGENLVEVRVSDGGTVVRQRTTVTLEDTKKPIVVVAPEARLLVEPRETYALRRSLTKPEVRDACVHPPTIADDAPNRLPIGETVVTWTVTDEGGNVAKAKQTVVVVNRAPVAEAGDDVRRTTKGERAQVALDGSASNDPDEHRLRYAWTADRGVPLENAKSPRPAGLFPIGVTEVTLTVTDEGGRKSTDAVRVVVRQDAARRDSAVAARSSAAGADRGLRLAAQDGYGPTLAAAHQETSAALSLASVPDSAAEDDAEAYAFVRSRQALHASNAAALLYQAYLAEGDVDALGASVEAYRSARYAMTDLAE